MLATKTKQKTLVLDSELISVLEKLKKIKPNLQGLDYLEILKQTAVNDYKQSLTTSQKNQSKQNSEEYVEKLTEEESIGIGISREEIRQGLATPFDSEEFFKTVMEE